MRLMRCKTVKKLLEAYTEGELDKSRQEAVEFHISTCQSCRQELEITWNVPRLVGFLSTPPVPDSIIPDTLRCLQENHGDRQKWIRSPGAIILRRWLIVAAASLLLVFTMFSIEYYKVHKKPEISAEEVESAAEEIRLAMGIVAVGTRHIQRTVLIEGVRTLNAAKSVSEDTIQAVSNARLEVFEKLQDSLAILGQLNLKEEKEL